MAHSELLSIQVALPRVMEPDPETEPGLRPWRSAFNKEPVRGPVHVGKLTVAGDGQADLAVHGGPDRPVLAYNGDHYARWQEELGLSDMPHGGFGENFTVAGLDEKEVCLGDRYAIGPVRLEVSQPRQPCWKLARRWQNNELPGLVIQHNRGGWYFRVLEEGTVEAGMTLELLDRPLPRWTIANAMHTYYYGKHDLEGSYALATCPPLSEQWRRYFGKRVGNGG